MTFTREIHYFVQKSVKNYIYLHQIVCFGFFSEKKNLAEFDKNGMKYLAGFDKNGKKDFGVWLFLYIFAGDKYWYYDIQKKDIQQDAGVKGSVGRQKGIDDPRRKANR